MKYIFNQFKDWFFVALLIGAIGGVSSFLFLFAIDFVIYIQQKNPETIYILPFIGIFIGIFYHKYGGDTSKGNNLIIEQINTQTQNIHWKMAPMVFSSTVMSHLVGASVGREGAAVQITASIADQIKGYDRKILLKSAAAAGFSAVFGTPMAGTLFAFEFWKYKNYNFNSILPILIASYFANFVCLSLGATHTVYKITENIGLQSILWLILASILFGLISRFYIYLAQQIKKYWNLLIKNPALRPAIGGIVILILYFVFDFKPYYGLGIEQIQKSFAVHSNWWVFLVKTFTTAFTISVGFKGGEVTPLFYIGATLGSALAYYLNLPVSLMAGLGLAAVFAAATKAPLACLALGIELFGFEFSPWFALSCYIAFLVSGKKSIYESQVQ